MHVREGVDHFKFGASRVHVSRFSIDARFAIAGKSFAVNVAIVPCKVLLLFSRPLLSGLGMCYNLADQEVDLAALGLEGLHTKIGLNGHLVLEVAQFPETGPPEHRPPTFEDVWVPTARAYMTCASVFALEAAPTTPEPEIFYPQAGPKGGLQHVGNGTVEGTVFWRGAKGRDF